MNVPAPELGFSESDAKPNTSSTTSLNAESHAKSDTKSDATEVVVLDNLEKRRLNELARRVLLVDRGDVILSIGQEVLIQRTYRPAAKRIQWTGERKKVPAIRFKRADIVYPREEVVELSREEKIERYRQKIYQSGRDLGPHIRSGEKIRCGSYFWTYEEFMEKGRAQRKRGIEEKLKTAEPYDDLRKLVLKALPNEKKLAQARKREEARAAHEALAHVQRQKARHEAWMARERARLPERARYFNERLDYWRTLFRGDPDCRVQKARSLKPCRDTLGEVYYRNVRDKYVPIEAFSYGRFPKY